MCGTEVDARRALENAFRLAGLAGDGWWALNSISVRVHDGNTDLDVLVGIPNVGLLIIEVKGWKAFNVDDRGKWFYPGKGGQMVSANDGPYKQAEREEYLLLQMLDGLRGRRALASGDLPKVGSCVLFGNLNSRTSGLPLIDMARTLFSDTFCPSDLTEVKAVDLLNRLRTIMSSQFSPSRPMDNSKNRLSAVQKVLSPFCSVRGMAVFADESQIQINAISEAALGEKASTYKGTRLYVEGAAGTGKTVYALKLAVERSRLTARPALFTCFSRRLAAEVRETPWIRDRNVIVGTPEELLERFGGSDRLKDFLREQDEATDAASRTALLMGNGAMRSLPRAYLDNPSFAETLVRSVADAGFDFSAVVVDEAQDLSDPLLEGLSSLVGSDDLYAIFADPRQTTRRERALQPWRKPKCLEGSDDLRMLCNYRNGDRIIDAVETEFGIGYELPPRGASPAEVRFDEYQSTSGMPELVSKVFNELLGEGLEPVVLVSGVSIRELGVLKNMGIEAVDVDEFKGLERKCVVLVQGPDPNPLDPNREDLYVGLTRATTVLTLVRQRA